MELMNNTVCLSSSSSVCLEQTPVKLKTTENTTDDDADDDTDRQNRQEER